VPKYDIMKTKNTTYLIILLVLMAGIALLLFLFGGQGSMHDRHRGFRIDETDQIVRIEITAGENQSIRLEKDRMGTWRFNQIYGANESAIRELLGTMRQLNVRRPVALADQDTVNSLLDKEGVQVLVTARLHLVRLPGGIRLLPFSRQVRHYVVGPETREGDGTYMRLSGSQIPFVLHIPGVESNLSEIFGLNLSVWRDPVVIDLSPDQIARIEVKYNQQPEESFVIDVSENHPLLLQNQVVVDSAHIHWDRVGRFLKSFTGLYYDRLLTPPADSLLQHELIEPDFFEITVVDHEGNKVNLVFYRRKADEETLKLMAPGTIADPNLFFMQVNGGEFTIGKYFVFNRVMRPLSFFLHDTGSR